MINLHDLIQDNREKLKCNWWDKFDELATDQQLGKPRPDVQKPAPSGAKLIDLIAPEDFTVGDVSLRHLIEKRRSHRYFSDTPLSLEELSFLLWSTQGITQILTEDGISYYKRTVPSGGNRHAFETYLSVHNVTGLEVGLYRYLPLDHKLVVLEQDDRIPARVSEGGLDQNSIVNGKTFYFVEQSAVTFIWTAIPYR
ncbi:MAG TPA: SagB/ThcOx family dehydrogenase, partial [Anaerolineales bacterium]|nr:SagB/ThcOx family dehydrogenase [Anaerolineales bacterium]